MTAKWLGVVALSLVFGAAARPPQGRAVNSVMREKLAHTQKILEAVVTSDWVGLEAESRELERLVNDPRWMVLKFPEYSRHSSAFVRSIGELRRAAAQRDLEMTPKAYVAVTLQCVDCHRYLARQRLAKRGGEEKGGPR
jgi:hypothetical protein